MYSGDLDVWRNLNEALVEELSELLLLLESVRLSQSKPDSRE